MCYSLFSSYITYYSIVSYVLRCFHTNKTARYKINFDSPYTNYLIGH